MGIVTVTKLENADKDADSLNTFINGSDTAKVKTRTNKEYPTLANAVRQVMETGGWEPFATEIALLASRPTITKKAAKALDTKKVWLWDGTQWNDTGLSELELAKNYTDSFFKNIIPDGVSLNSITTTGTYYRLLSSELNTPELGYPYRIACVLEVFAEGRFVYQTCTSYIANNKKSFRAAWRPSGTSEEELQWTPWKEIATTDDIANLKADIPLIFNTLFEQLTTKRYSDTLGNSFDVSFIDKDKQIAVAAFATDVAYLLDTYLRKTNTTQFSDINGSTALAIERDGTVVIPKFKTPLHNALKTHMGQRFKADYLGINSDGQSLALGTRSVETINVSQPFFNVMLAGGVWSRVTDAGFIYGLVPLTSIAGPNTTSRNETSLVSLVNKLSEYDQQNGVNPANKRYLAINSGVGSTEIEKLEKGTDYYATRLATVRAAYQACKDQGKTFKMFATNWVQGERQHNTGFKNPTSDYMEHMVGLHDDFYNDLLEFIPDQPRPYNLTYQVNVHRHYKTIHMDIGIAHWLVTRKHPNFILTTPCYVLPLDADKLHLTSEGYYLFGLYQARALAQTIYGDGEKFRPVEPIQIDWQDTHIDIKFHVRTGLKLRLSEELVPMQANFGFDLWADEVTDTPLDAINSVDVISSDTIRIALKTAQPMALLTYARGRINGDSPILYTESRGNLHDNWGDYEQVTLPISNTIHKMHNASVMFRYNNLKGFF